MATLGRDTIADEIMAGIDLTGKTAVVTGATAGLGEETSRVFSAAGARVIMTGRSDDKLASAIARIRESVPEAKLEAVILELGEPDSARAAAAAILRSTSRIDILVNNAGVMAPPLSRNSLGWESQFAGNHMGHFILTGLLMPAIIAAAPARIVNLASSGHQMSPILFDDPHFERQDYSPYTAYGQSKTANIQYTLALAERLKGKGVTANAVMPGIVATPLFRHSGGTSRIENSGLFVKNIPQGAATQTWVAVAPELEGVTGGYFEDCGPSPVNDDPTSVALFGYRSWVMDHAAAERLWQLSETLAGETFVF